MVKEINRYRVINVDESQILGDNLTKEEADYFLYIFSYEIGISNLKIEEYFPVQTRARLGRDIDLY